MPTKTTTGDRDRDLASASFIRRPGRWPGEGTRSLPWPARRLAESSGEHLKTYREYASGLAHLLREADSFAAELRGRRTPAGEPLLTEAGVREELRRHAEESLTPRLRRLARSIAAARANAEARAREISPVRRLDPADAAGAIARMELRAWLRSLSTEERSNVLLKAEGELLDSALEMPEVAGVAGPLRELLFGRAVKQRHPEEAGQLADEHEALEAVEQALRLVEQELKLDSTGDGTDDAGEEVLDLVLAQRREQATPPRDGDPQQRARQQPLAEAAHPRSAWRGASSGENPFD